jgi:dedicator of cytokinesis protein 3
MPSCEAIQLKHPTAMIHQSKIPPPEAVRHGPEPVIWVTSLVPEPDLSLPVFSDRVSDSVQRYWRHNEVTQFSTTRPYAKDRGETQAVLSWTEKTVLTGEWDDVQWHEE